MGFLRKKISKVENKLNKLNLNRDEINCFKTETGRDQSRTRGAMWAKSLRLKSKVENHIGGKLLSSIYGVPPVEIR